MSGSRTVTVMFTDMVDSTRLSVSEGEQTGKQVRRRLFELMRGAVAATGGTEVKNRGDGLMVTFPTVRAGLEAAVLMQRRAARSNRRQPSEIHLRIGMSVGDAAHEDGDWFGTAVNEAARLCDDAASADQVLVTEQVRLLADPKGPGMARRDGRELKGLPGPTAILEVAWARPYPEECERPLPRLLEIAQASDFVARRKELECLTEVLERAYDGPRQIALVCGEPGIGKTTLAAEAASIAREKGVRLLYGRNEQGVGTAYQPFVEILGDLVSRAPTTLLAGHVAEHGGELRRLAPILAARMPRAPEPRSIDAEEERYELYTAVVDLLARVAEDPLLLVIDDLHWADKPTIDLLRFVTRPEGAPITLIATYRDSESYQELNDLIADLQRGPGVEKLGLKGLDERDVMTLLERGGHHVEREPEEFAQRLCHETAGNPFFIKELLRSQREDDRVSARPDLTATGRSLPDAVRGVIVQRFERLSEPTRQALRTAAVVGREFELELVREALDVDEDELSQRLDEAVRASLLAEFPGVPGKFVFPHALVPEALNKDVGPASRRREHARIARALETLYGGQPGGRAAELARHWDQAALIEELPKAIRYSMAAGEHALAQLAPSQAADWYALALEQYGRADGDAELRCDILIALGRAQALAGMPEHREVLFDAFEAARDLGDRARAVRAALANGRGVYTSPGEVDHGRVRVFEHALVLAGERDCVERAELLAHLAGELAFAGEPDRVRARSDEALRIVRGMDDPRTLIHVIAERAIAIWWPDTLAIRRAEAEEAMRAALDIGDPLARFHAYRCHAYALICAGELDEADADYDEALRLADRTPDPMAHWMARVIGATLATIRGEFAEGQRLAYGAAEIATRSGQKDAPFVSSAQLGHLQFERGTMAELQEMAAEMARQFPLMPLMSGISALAAAEAGSVEVAGAALKRGAELGFAPPDITWAGTISSHALACARIGDRDTARLLRPLLEPYAGQVAYTAANAWLTVDHHLGALARVDGCYDAAEKHLADAAHMARRMRAPLWLARAQIEQARTRIAAGAAPAEVTPLLEQAREVAARLGAPGVERDAASLLQEPEGAMTA